MIRSRSVANVMR